MSNFIIVDSSDLMRYTNKCNFSDFKIVRLVGYNLKATLAGATYVCFAAIYASMIQSQKIIFM